MMSKPKLKKYKTKNLQLVDYNNHYNTVMMMISMTTTTVTPSSSLTSLIAVLQVMT